MLSIRRQTRLVNTVIIATTMKTDGIEELFKQRVSNIDSIFTSFRDLHQMYSQMLSTANVNSNSLTAFDRMKKSVATKQRQISSRLYAQAFILLTGAAEALLKDVFEDLLVKNFATITGASGLSFTTKELQQAIVDSVDSPAPLDDVSAALGHLTISKIFKTKNPTEKINFQNVLTMKSTFLQYFAIDIPDSVGLSSIHRYWQVRHVLVHNDGVIDERFRHNVKTVGLLQVDDVLGKKIRATKKEFDQATTDFQALFRDLGALIASAGLTSDFVTELSD